MMIHAILQDQDHSFRSYLGRYLKYKRQGMNMSAKDVAVRAGLAESSYRNLEYGRAKITFENLQALFSILQLDLKEIFEINKISKVAFANAIAKELSENYPQ